MKKPFRETKVFELLKAGASGLANGTTGGIVGSFLKGLDKNKDGKFTPADIKHFNGSDWALVIGTLAGVSILVKIGFIDLEVFVQLVQLLGGG